MVEFLEGAGLCTDTSHRRTQSRKTDPQNDHSVHHPGAHALEGPFTRSVLLMHVKIATRCLLHSR